MVGLGASALAETSPEGYNARLEWDQFAHDYPIWVAIDYVVALQIQEGADYVSAIQEAEAKAAREALVRQRNTIDIGTALGPVYRSSGGTGECGGATNGADQYIQRESHGQADVWNTQGSGAWGCYQIMPFVWQANCTDLGTHGQASASAQAQCASRLPISAWR
jgi:hypothetical protein